VIPQAVLWRLFGFTIHADWNLQALHPPCNQAKGESATAEAVRVAAVHGLDLGAWGSWLAQDGLWDTA
jgi:hypothetical protein